MCPRAALAAVCLLAGPVAAETVRIATYNVDLTRSGPGVLLHDLSRAPDAAIRAVIDVITRVRPEVILLNRIDYDYRGRALDIFADLLRAGPGGIDYPHRFSAPVNSGMPIGFDLDDDGRLADWDDNFGFGKFPGYGGMAILSQHPIDAEAARTFQSLLWRDLPGAQMPTRPDGTPFPSAEAQQAMRLSSAAHWDVPVTLGGGTRLHLLASQPTPPLFDGDEKMNQLRNFDEIGFWTQYLGGTAFTDDQGRTGAAPDAPLVVLGDLNTDPFDGAGRREGITRLLAHPALQDPEPQSAGAIAAARSQGGANRRHDGPAAQDTADWRDTGGPGNLRVDYILPARSLRVENAGVFWPAPGETLAKSVAAGPPHRLVWVDLELP